MASERRNRTHVTKADAYVQVPTPSRETAARQALTDRLVHPAALTTRERAHDDAMRLALTRLVRREAPGWEAPPSSPAPPDPLQPSRATIPRS